MLDILQQDIKFVPGVGPHRKDILEKELGVKTFGDLLEYYPYKYVDRSHIYSISDLSGEMPYVQLKGNILSFEEFDMGPRKKRIVAHFTDGTGIVDLVWFARAQQLTKGLRVDTEYIVFGKPSIYGGRYQFAHPEIEKASELTLSDMGMQPYYSTTEKMKKMGMTSRTIERITKSLLERLTTPLPETLPAFITNRLRLVSRDTAFRHVHYPKTADEMSHARQRLKFEELFYVQLNILRYASDQRRKYRGYVFSRVGDLFNTFYRDYLPFPLTGAQKRVIREIRTDMGSGRQMNRLLQGDVGSGKTLVALMSMLIALDNGYQACIMAPTEILAEQHLATIREFLKDMPIRVELLTGIVKGKKRREVLQGIADGSVQILVGTHAVIEDTVQFLHLGFVVVDEQHRFGVAQRAKLWGKSANPPHVLVMTATPIPRTLAMTIYGDLDVSVIDELPPGRKPVVTIHKYDNQMTSLYQGIRQQIHQGRQVYIVFPLIQESEKIDLKNLEDGFAALREVFPEFRMSKVHGKMKPADKEEEMQRFDCILVSKYELSSDTRRRLDIMCDTNDGFQIAEADLKLRGPGDLEGTQQSGMAFDLKIADIARDGQLVQLARDEAQRIIDDDPECRKTEYQMLWNRLAALRKTNINWGAIS